MNLLNQPVRMSNTNNVMYKLRLQDKVFFSSKMYCSENVLKEF